MKKLILLIIFLLTLCGCKTTTKTITEYKDVYVHDTTEVYIESVVERKIAVHDTIVESVNTIIRDSVVYYMDADGNVVNKEHYRNEVNDRNKETIRSLESSIDSLNTLRQREAMWYQSELNRRENEVVEKKPWYLPITMWCSILFMAALLLYALKKWL